MNADGDSDEGAEKCHPPIRERHYQPVATSYGDVPHGALVTAAQAESALGNVEATELDDADLETPDKDLRAEEEALLGRHVNPEGIAYDCMCPPFDAAAASPWQHTALYGWHPPLLPRHLSRDEFDIHGADIVSKLSKALHEQLASFTLTPTGPNSNNEKEIRIAALDPTQLVVHDVVEGMG